MKQFNHRVLGLLLMVLLLTTVQQTTHAALSFFANRATFESTNPGLTVENFEAGRVVSGLGFSQPLDANTDNAYFSPGDVVPGLRIRNGHPLFTPLLDVVAPPRSGLVSKVIFNSSEGGVPRENPMIIELLDGASAVGFDAYNLNSSGSVFATDTEVSIFGDSGLIGMSNYTTESRSPIFFGVSSDAEPITRIEIVGRHRSFLIQEGVDNVSFTSSTIIETPVPEPVTGMFAIGGVMALCISATRRSTG